MRAQNDRQALKRNTPENSEHADVTCRRICHVARTTAASVKEFQELSTCKMNGYKGADRGIMVLEMEKLIDKTVEEMNVANGEKVF
jgi:ferritin-like protein